MNVLIMGPSNIGPYHYARLKALAQRIGSLTYLKIFARQAHRPWTGDVGSPPCTIREFREGARPDRFIKEESPDCIISVGYRDAALLKLAWAARRKGTPVILQFETTARDKIKRSYVKEMFKSFAVRTLYSAAFVTGQRAADYVQTLGILRDRIWSGAAVVDNDHFSRAKEPWQKPENFPNRFFLTVLRLAPEKNVQRLLDVFSLYQQQGGDFGLVIVGTGPAEEQLKRGLPAFISDKVYWYGWAKYDDLPILYHSAHCFILPSLREPWGLVVNEAMAAGLPVIISDRCGCVEELCLHGRNGYRFDPENETELLERLVTISSDRVDLEAMGRLSQQIISSYSPIKWAETVITMIKTVTRD